MAKKKTKAAGAIDYSKTDNLVELYLAKAIGENVTLPATDDERVLVYLRKLIEVIEQSNLPLYEHSITIWDGMSTGGAGSNLNLACSIISNDSTPFTKFTLTDYINENVRVLANGTVPRADGVQHITYFLKFNDTVIIQGAVDGIPLTNVQCLVFPTILSTNAVFVDTVRQI